MNTNCVYRGFSDLIASEQRTEHTRAGKQHILGGGDTASKCGRELSLTERRVRARR